MAIDLIKFRDFAYLKNGEVKKEGDDGWKDGNCGDGTLYVVGYKDEGLGGSDPEFRVELNDIGDIHDHLDVTIDIDNRLYLTFDGQPFGTGYDLPTSGGEGGGDFDVSKLHFYFDNGDDPTYGKRFYLKYGDVTVTNPISFNVKMNDDGQHLDFSIGGALTKSVLLPAGSQSGVTSVVRRKGDVEVKTVSEIFNELYPNHNIDDYKGKVLTTKTKLLVNGVEDPYLIPTYLSIPTGDTPGSDSGETEVIVMQPELRNVTVTDLPNGEYSSGHFVAVTGEENTYDLELNIRTLQGIQGEQGIPGQDGRDGTSVTILESQEVCIEHGDSFLGDGTTTVVTQDGTITTIDGHLYVLSDVTNRIFKDVGEIKGPQGEQGADGKGYDFAVSQDGSNTILLKTYSSDADPTRDYMALRFALAQDNKNVLFTAEEYRNGSMYRRVGTASLKLRNGTDGANGQSAYEVWQNDGHQGASLDEFYDFITGPRGLQGPVGPQGPQGGDGTTFELYRIIHTMATQTAGNGVLNRLVDGTDFYAFGQSLKVLYTVQKFNTETGDYENVDGMVGMNDLTAFNNLLTNQYGNPIIDTCPDTERGSSIATNMRYGIFGMWNNNTNLNGDLPFGFNICAVNEMKDTDNVEYVVVTVKVYKNIQ